MVAMVRATASMSALTKFRVTGSPLRGADGLAGLIAAGVGVAEGGTGCACAEPASHDAQAAPSQKRVEGPAQFDFIKRQSKKS
jgi:hypothetical protein